MITPTKPHVFSETEKTSAMTQWHGALQAALDEVRDAINEADTLERWASGPTQAIPERLVFAAVAEAQDQVNRFLTRIERIARPYRTFIIGRKNLAQAKELVEARYGLHESQDGNNPGLRVELWAVDRVRAMLKNLKIRFYVEEEEAVA